MVGPTPAAAVSAVNPISDPERSGIYGDETYPEMNG